VDRLAAPKTMQSGSPEAQNIKRRSRFLNALRSRRGDRSTAVPKKSGFNVVSKDCRKFSRQLCGSALGKPARAAIGRFQIRDLQVAFRFTAPNFTTSTIQ